MSKNMRQQFDLAAKARKLDTSRVYSWAVRLVPTRLARYGFHSDAPSCTQSPK